MTAPKISVVIPVKNEHENIGRCLAGLADALRDVEHEILVAYDSDDDTTLPAIERAERKSPVLRLVKNSLGPSPSFAIRAGLAAATGDVVVVTMADLSDPPEAILRIADKIRRGADVVSGSRYMRGGRQIGGPRWKSFLSRAAGVSLHWVAGIGTHDATTSFRGFSRRLLQEVPLTSDQGFTFGIEATVKAHLGGFLVDEVPVTWTDRTAGQSNFRVAKWLPAYLAWYGRAMRDPFVVWSLCAMSAVAMLWRGANPSAALWVVCGSAVLIVLARRLRGRTHLQDGLIPIGWLLACSGSSTRFHPLAGVAIAGWPIMAAWRAGRVRAALRAA